MDALAAYIGAWVATIGGTWLLFERAESVLRPQALKEISQWLLRRQPKRAVVNPFVQFGKIFDSVFDSRATSGRRFMRTAVACFGTVIVMRLLLRAFKPEPAAAGRALDSLIMLGLLFNLVPAYLSVVQTRWLVRRMAQSKSQSEIGMLLVCDLVLSAAITIVCVIFGNMALTLIAAPRSQSHS